MESHRVSMARMLVLVFVAVLMAKTVAAPCCANIESVGDTYACVDFGWTLDECCPDETFWYGADPWLPDSQSDCQANYYSGDDTCDELDDSNEVCELGCCCLDNPIETSRAYCDWYSQGARDFFTEANGFVDGVTCQEMCSCEAYNTCTVDIPIDCPNLPCDEPAVACKIKTCKANQGCVIQDLDRVIDDQGLHRCEGNNWCVEGACVPRTGECIDADNDGYGKPASPFCSHPEEDCAPTNININPGKPEICNNNVDENCNGIKKCCNDADMGAATCEAAYERCECGQATLLDIANKRCCIHTAPYVFDTTVCPGVCQIPAECSNYDGNEPGCVGHTCVWCGLLNECLDTCAGCVESSTVNTCVENQVCKACQPCDLACGPNADCVPASTPVCQCENGYFLDDCTNQFQPGPGKICEERACDACNQAGGTCCPNACSEIPGNLCEEGLFCCAECTSFTCCEAYQSCPAGKEYPQNDDNCIGIACTVACQDRACPEIIQAGTPPCKCGPDIFPTNGQGPYCCATGLQAMPCGPPTATGVISGVIKSSLADDPFMGNVVVSFTQDGNNKMTVLGTGWENRLGEWVLPYSKELAVGQYHVSARGAEFSHIWDKTYEGVTEKPNVELTDSEQEFRDIIIKPSACGVSNPMPVTSFIAEHVKGVAGAKLTWTDCGSTGIVGYNIYRKEKLGAENYVDAGSKIISRSRQLVDTNYDFGSEAKWDTTYKYEIEVLYGNGNINSDRVSITPDFFTGNEPCEGITDDSEICMHKCQAGAVYQHYDGTDDSWCGAASDAADKKNRLRLFCDDENLLDHHSSPAVYDCTVRLLSESAYCTGPDSEGTTHCTVASECTEEDNPFGLYYNHDSCIYFDEGVKKSCYFDYSPYIVDTCKQCDDDTGSCFDYDSAAACTEDNCEYGDSYGGCAWTGNDYQEFGKGYCAPKNYKGTDHCADCNSGELFMDCNNQVCNALGLCMYSGTCQACNAQLGCKDYTSQASCGDFKINSMLSCQASSPLVPGTIVYGNDGCGIGVCRWVANGCIHDADYDGTDDCYEGDWFCQSDGTPPETSLITTGLKVNKQGGTAEFRIKDNKARKGRLYYCLEKKDTTCCVNNSVEYEDYDDPEATRTLTFLQDPGLGSEDLASPGLYRFRFFSQDDFKNFEQAKTSSYFMVDTQEPQISIQVSLLPDTSTEFNSFITADVQVPNDPSTCTVTLGGGDLSEGTFTDTGPHTFIGQYFTHTYEESHSDGQYTLTVSCTDLVGNQNTVNHRFEIDNDINIDNMEPEPKAYHSATQTLKLTTLFQDDTCTIIQAKHGLPAQDYTLTQTAFTNTYWGTDGKKHHSLPLTLGTDKYYNFRVKCTHGETSDYGNFIFSIDRKAPESYMRIFNSNGYEYFDHDEHQVRYITNAVQAINLYSEDQDFDGANMKLGLADIKYCFASSFSLCGGLGPQVRSASDGASIAGFTGGWICFKGLDRDDGSGHNEEAETCIEISIDADAPTIWLESPPNGFVTDQNEVTVRGRYQEQNVQEIKIIVRDAQNNYHIHDVTDYAGYRFEKLVGLLTWNPYEATGSNQIKASIKDFSGVTAESPPLNVYYDNKEPNTECNITKGEELINNPGHLDSTLYAEFGQPIGFKAEVIDHDYTHGENEDNELDVSMYDSRSNLIGNVEMEAQDTKGILWQGSYEGLLEPGNYYAIFKGKDRFGHENRTIADFTVKDTTGPTFTVEIGEPYPTDRVAKKGVQYPVLVTASEPLLTTPNMGYEYDGTAVDEIQLMFVDSTTFRGTLEVSGCTDCEDEAWFVIRGRDTHGQEATKRLPFNIDTTVPTAPRIIFPEEEEVLAQQDILIEGLADPDTEVNIWVKLLFGENYTEETVTSAERSTPIGIASSTTLLTAGATTINFRGDRSSYEGKYVEADGFELPRYHILQASYDEATDTTLASLDQALRYDTATSIFYVYNEEHHTGYFSLPLEAMEGVNIAQANSEDPAGPGPASEERMFVADWHPPHAEVIYPLDGTITSDVLTNVKLRVRDYTSGLDLDSVRLTLNGMAFDYWDLMYDSRDPKTRGPAVDAWHYLNLSEVQDSQGQYNPLSIQDGTYTAVFTAADSAGNTQTMQWSFEIEPTATRYPELDLEDANAFEKLYTKLEEFEGILTFFEDAVEVISSGLEPGGIVTTTPQPGQEKIHDVEFANVDIHRPHNTFTIESKEKVGNSYRQPGRHIWQIVRDDELPTINTQYPATTSDLLVPIHGKITEYSFDNLRAEGELNSLILEWEDGGTHTTVPVIGPKDLYDNSYFAAVIGLEDDEEREIPFSVKACDKAGNCRSEKYVIRIDFTPPEISGIQFQQLNSETPIELTLGTNEEAYCRWAIGMVTRYENMVNQFTAGEGSKQHTAMIDLDEGLQTYSLSCMDIAGNPMDSSVKVQIELDTTGPAFSELYPANGTMLFSTNLISARIEDRNGVKEDSILMMVDGNDVGSNLQYLSGVAMHTPGPLVEGQHTVWVGAYDNLDNYNQVQWDFTINQTIPKPPRFMLHGEETDSTNETLPVIYVIFSQPVIIYDNYTLEGEDIDLIQTDYSFTPKTRLNEGYHTFVIYARLADNSGHIGQYRFSFSIESEFDIILEEPEHGVAPTKVFDITYRTPGDATCKYDYIQEQNYDQFAHDFDITGQQEHTIYDYNISWNSFMFVACKLSFGPEKPPKLFSFRVDETPPRITELYAVPNPIAERTNVSSVWLYLTELNIKTDEPAMCRFNNETYVGYDLMQNPMGTEFVTTHTRDLTMYHDRNYTFFVSCKNRAGLNSSIKKLVVMADASLPLTARFIEIGATGSQSVRLQASTNKRAMCKFFNESWNPAGSSPFGMEHLLPLTNLKSGEHTYWINCTRNMESHKTSITFIVDLTPPVLIVNDTSDDQDNPGKSWRTDKLRLKWTAYDNETELGLVLYRLEKSSGAAIVNWTEAEEEDRWFWVDEDNSGEPLNLSDGQTYYFRVNASNTVGRSKVERTDGVTIDTSLEPPDQPSCSDNRRNQGETDIDCGGPCPGCDLDDDCEDGTDCLSEYCEDGKCEVHHCDNNRTDGDETDKDCGGSCDPCGDGKDCEEDDDCDSDYCNNGKKCATPSCTDNVKNGLETDTDCGGHHCDACADGKDCEDNTDCESTFCSSAGLCEEPTCDDNAENGDESDVDCGGSCDKCQEGKKCLANDDCTTGQCGDSGICTSSDDNDNDGMPDSWELLHGLDTTRDDSLEDPDGDTLTNIDEYRYGFDPHNADSDGDGIPDNLEIGGLGDEKPKTWTIVLLIIGILALAGFGGYYLYTHFLKKPKPYYRPVTQAPVPRQGPRRPMQKPVPKPAIPATPPKRRKLFKTRTKLFDTFEKPGKKTDKIPLKEEKGETKEEEGKWLQLGKAEPDDVFSRLKKMGRPEEARKPPKDDVFSKLKGIGKTDESTDESVDEDVFSKLKGIGDAKPKKKKGKEDVFSKLKKIGK